MKWYKCHKRVKAAKIIAIRPTTVVEMVDIVTEGGENLKVFQDWMQKHEPAIGGYLVTYEDGYTSYSPAAAFESGYTLETL